MKAGAKTEGKVYLDVPYIEREKAKALGAHWDWEAKRWYANGGADLEPLWRWVPQERPWIYIVTHKKTCWKCHGETTVVAFGVPYRQIPDEDGVVGVCENGPGLWDSVHLIPRLAVAPKEVRDYLARTNRYVPAHSKASGELRLSNTCNRCGAIQGDWFDFYEPGGTFYIDPYELSRLGELEFARVHTDGEVWGPADWLDPADKTIFEWAEAHHTELDLGIFEDLIFLP